MGFLSGRKKINAEQRIIEIKTVINALTLKVRKFESLITEEHAAAKVAAVEGRRERAKLHLKRALDFESRRDRYYQQKLTLETSLILIEEAQDQSAVQRALRLANEALEEAKSMIDTTEIQSQLDRIAETFEEIELAGDILSENLNTQPSTYHEDEIIERQLQSLEAEIIVEREQNIPSPSHPSPPTSDELDDSTIIEQMLRDLKQKTSEERAREIQL